MKRIFLDYASSTPVAPEVIEAMRPWSQENFANPSALYSEALNAKEAVRDARKKIAECIGAQEKEIVCTSSGTESNNLALLGVFEASRRDGFVPHVVTTTIEHPSVLEVCEEIKRRGGEVTYVPVSEEGIVSPHDIRSALRENTVLVSVMMANNEIGTIQPIKEIGRVVKDWRAKHESDFPYVHVDSCQAILYEDVHVLKLGVDLLTLDGIKMYGPRGMGMLYIRDGVSIKPILFGGGQERGLRSSTENVAGIVGLATALELAVSMRENEAERLKFIRDYGIDKIVKEFPTASLNGSLTERLPNNINVCFPGLDAEFAVISLDVAGVSASYSSSCRTLKEDSSSYVVSALGKPECSTSSLRFTLGRESTKDDMNTLVSALKKILNKR